MRFSINDAGPRSLSGRTEIFKDGSSRGWTKSPVFSRRRTRSKRGATCPEILRLRADFAWATPKANRTQKRKRAFVLTKTLSEFFKPGLNQFATIAIVMVS